MTDTAIHIIIESWNILLDSSIYIFFGFFIAGLLKAFLPENLISSHLGNGKLSSVLKASALGVPIPLCSCGVIPAAAGLREQGASKGATASFMISTPETGVDSIAVTYALLDPIMTIIRPVAAFITATVTGIFINTFDKTETNAAAHIFTAPSCGGHHCACGSGKSEKKNVLNRFSAGMSFAFGDLFTDISRWLAAGVLIAGGISLFVSPGLIETYMGDGLFSMLIALAVSAPLYICATASTPIAAALALKGLSPGAALVFLLAGPATNAATISVVAKILGKKSAVIYLTVIIVVTFSIGMATNYIYAATGHSIVSWIQGSAAGTHGWFSVASASLLLIMIIKSFIPASLLKRLRSGKHFAGRTHLGNSG